jgi:hypothetical protein
LKIQIDNLEFNSDYFYIQSDTIVEKIIFNNRTFYSKYKKYDSPLTSELIEQYKRDELTLALPLIEDNIVNYLVIEYYQNDWKNFYSLIQHLFKTLNIHDYIAYRNPNRELLQIFIIHKNTPLRIAYEKIDKIKQMLELKSKKSYRIFPNKNSPKNYNIITFPLNII